MHPSKQYLDNVINLFGRAEDEFTRTLRMADRKVFATYGSSAQ